MSATAGTAGVARTPPLARVLAAAGRAPVPLRAFLASRLLVLCAGAAGAMTVPLRTGWWPSDDPLRLSERLGSVGNVLAASAVRWDSIHYLQTAQHGYTSAASTVFYPLYPLLVRVLGTGLGSDVGAGVLISLAALAVALILLHRLTELELGRRAADVTVMLLAFAPLSFYFSAVYTESLYLVLSVGSVYAARRGRWRLAGILGGLAAATRVTGIGLVLLLGLMYVKERGVDRHLAWLAAIPAGLLAYLGFTAAKGYGFTAPFAGEGSAQYHHQMAGSLQTVVSAVRAAASGARALLSQPLYQPSLGGPFAPSTDSILLLVVLAVAIVTLVWAFRRLPIAYGMYSLAVLLVCTWSPVDGQPLKSFDRYALTIFPLWMAAGAWLSERRRVRPVLLVSAGLLAFWTFQFATWAWVA
ncbi:MAG: DUF2029 domain-containing protein [Solirubrobacterales bacterium]|nr:DUF2029 domain-containing protein [Solirubrobacterales bacterium]